MAPAFARWHKVIHAEERLRLCRLVIKMIRNVHLSQVPPAEQATFGAHFEAWFVLAAIAIGDFEGRPMSATKISAYLEMPRTTVLRKLSLLRNWGLIYEVKRHFYLEEAAFNSVISLSAYRKNMRLLSEAAHDLEISAPDL
jgi:hypothetical protein